MSINLSNKDPQLLLQNHIQLDIAESTKSVLGMRMARQVAALLLLFTHVSTQQETTTETTTKQTKDPQTETTTKYVPWVAVQLPFCPAPGANPSKNTTHSGELNQYFFSQGSSKVNDFLLAIF